MHQRDFNNNLENYLEYLLVQKNYSDYTILNYKEDLLSFNNFCIKEGIDYEDITYSQAKK